MFGHLILWYNSFQFVNIVVTNIKLQITYIWLMIKVHNFSIDEEAWNLNSTPIFAYKTTLAQCSFFLLI